MKPIDLITVTCESCKMFINVPKGKQAVVKFCYSCGAMINVPNYQDIQPFHADFQKIVKDLENVKKCLEKVADIKEPGNIIDWDKALKKLKS